MRSSCKYCGNNQVPHFLHWYTESLNIVLTPIRKKILYNFFTEFAARKNWGQLIARFFLFLGEAFKIISRQGDLKKCKVRRAQVLWEEVEKREMKMEELLLFGKAFDSYILDIGKLGYEDINKVSTYSNIQYPFVFSGLPRPAGYYNPKLDLMDDKAWFKKEMQKNGLPVPVGGAVTRFGQAKEILGKISGQWAVGSGQKKQGQTTSHYSLTTDHFCIVKPRSGSRGRHSTTFISSMAELESAFKIAKQLCHWVVVEQQLFGPVYRATVINFKLEGVLRGDSPKVIGDGKKTVRELVEEKNNAPHLGVKDIVLDEKTESFVQRQILIDIKKLGNSSEYLNINNIPTSSLDYTPAKDQKIFLSEKIGVNYGGSSSEELEICHPDNVALFERAAKILGDPILGFDFIIPEITKSYKQQVCGFIEVNTLPFINLHHDALHGKAKNVASKILDMQNIWP